MDDRQRDKCSPVYHGISCIGGKIMELHDKVRVKSQNIIGFIVDIIEDSYTVEKEGNEGPIYWNLPKDDLEPIE